MFWRGVLVFAGGASIAIAAQSGPRFEVASVKAHRSGGGPSSIGFRNETFQATNATARMLIRNAFDIQDAQLIEAPSWAATERFDVTAKHEGDPPLAVRLAMLQSLLAERFKLVVERQSRELPIYSLVKSKAEGPLGPAVKATACVDTTPPKELPATPDGPAPCGMMLSTMGMLKGRGVTLERVASILTSLTGRITSDRTGLQGTFDFELKWTPDNLPPRAPGTASGDPIRVNGIAIDPDGPSIFSAVQEQLGLKLESGKATMPVVVVKRLEHPTDD